jgi:hypothetical protein
MKIDEDLRTVVNKIVYIRDKDKPCIICGFPLGNNILNVCHHIKKSQSSVLKYALTNQHLGHQWCNQQEETDGNLIMSHSMNVIEREGEEEFMRLNNLKRQTVKFGNSEKKELLILLKNELKLIS